MGLTGDIAARYDIASAAGYAGDVSPRTAWRMLQEIAESVLVDVRTTAEWSYVGGPDTRALDKAPVTLEWQVFPSMQVDGAFAARLASQVGDNRETPLLMLCRSGARSAAAAKAMTSAGYRRCFNVADGFEGPLDAAGHRGGTAGWKADGLPWSQK